MSVTVNLCGEGEVTGAINVNLLDPDLLTRKLETVLAAGPCIKADVVAVPLRTGSVDTVVGNMLPYGTDWMDAVASEAYRILVSGGEVALYSTSGGGAIVLPHLAEQGFIDLKLADGYARGRRP